MRRIAVKLVYIGSDGKNRSHRYGIPMTKVNRSTELMKEHCSKMGWTFISCTVAGSEN